MTEQQPYRIMRNCGVFEVRSYPEHLLAEVVIEGTFESAGNRAFRYLFAYISGENHTSQKIAMTAPVAQEPAPEKISMTAPVIQQEIKGQGNGGGMPKFRVSFVLPQRFTVEDAPAPTNPLVHLRLVPRSVAVVIRFSGRWSTANYQQHLQTLRIAVRQSGLTAIGPPRFARFDPPFKPWFLRHNEIALDIEEAELDGTGSSPT